MLDYVFDVYYKIIPYSGKLWRTLNLANWLSECTGEILIWKFQMPYVYNSIYVMLSFGRFLFHILAISESSPNCQINIRLTFPLCGGKFVRQLFHMCTGRKLIRQ